VYERRASRRRCEISEAAGVIAAVAADQVNPSAILVGDDASAVHFLLVDLARSVKRLADERGGHVSVLRDHRLALGLRPEYQRVPIRKRPAGAAGNFNSLLQRQT
jgi:hypothetical protein